MSAVEQVTAALDAVAREVDASLTLVKQNQRRANDIARDLDARQATLASLNAQVERATAAASEKLAVLHADVATAEEQKAKAESELKSVRAALADADAALARIRERVA